MAEQELENMETEVRVINGIEIPYVKRGDYWFPALTNSAAESFEWTAWGQAHMDWLVEMGKEKYGLYLRRINLVTTGKLYPYLEDIQTRAQDLMERTVDQLWEQQGVNVETLSDEEWLSLNESIMEQAREIVLNEVIYR